MKYACVWHAITIDVENEVQLATGNNPHIVFVKAINITRPVCDGKHEQVQQQLFSTPCHTLCVLGFSALCKHHMVRIFQTKRN